MKPLHFEAIFDPYDLWSSTVGVFVKKGYYAGVLWGKAAAICLSVFDWLIPGWTRWMTQALSRKYPIVIAHEILRYHEDGACAEFAPGEMLVALRSIDVSAGRMTSCAWGLGFPWMSKNGLYGPDVPFVTHTPYAMEASLTLASHREVESDAMEIFHGTWTFLESLKVMHEGDEGLALSYAPIDEPRMVVNANSYAAFAYALHAVYGKDELRESAKRKCERIVRWVVQQQAKNGSWFYYADKDTGNFIDCFHSCFVVKNLLKVSKLLPDLSDFIRPVADNGWKYIQSELYDKDEGLCRRFAVRAQRDPFRWDLYDQAEYLGLLVDFGQLEEAKSFAERVEMKFRKGEHWYCRIDIFNRRWGKDFLRWGIVPFWYHSARLQNALKVN